MSVGDVNSVDPTMGIDPTGGVYPSTVPEHVTLFRRAIESAQNNMTAGQRYAFNNLNRTTTDAAPAVKTPPSNAPVSQPNNGLSGIARGFGIIGSGLTTAQLLNNYAARQHTVTEYYGSNLALRVYPEGQPGPDGAKANFLKTGRLGGRMESSQLRALIRYGTNHRNSPLRLKTRPSHAPRVRRGRAVLRKKFDFIQARVRFSGGDVTDERCGSSPDPSCPSAC